MEIGAKKYVIWQNNVVLNQKPPVPNTNKPGPVLLTAYGVRTRWSNTLTVRVLANCTILYLQHLTQKNAFYAGTIIRRLASFETQLVQFVFL